jgi:hypothetical protein
VKASTTGRRAYALLLRLYPRHFRSEFADEMQDVFESALDEAAGLGFARAAGVWLRELRDLPVNLVRERRWDAAAGVREASMSVGPGHSGRGEGSGPAAEAPASWRESLAGAGLFLLLPALGGVYTAIYVLLGGQGPRPSTQYEDAGSMLLALIVAGLIAVACYAWIHSFPRWSFPYLGFGLVFSLLMSAVVSSATILGHQAGRVEQLLWRAFVPALSVAVISLLATRSLQPLRQLAGDVWNDWTRISFALYAMLPIPLLLRFDETHANGLLLAGFPLLLGLGALSYMRSTRTWQRAASLAGGLAASWLVATAWLTAYFHGRQEPWMSAPTDVYRMAAAMSGAGAVLMAQLLAPALLGLAHWGMHRLRPRHSA